MIPNTLPPLWNSVHRPIPFIYSHVQRTGATLTESGGFLLLTVPVSFGNVDPVAGDKIAIEGCSTDAYNTIHTVQTVNNPLSFLLETESAGAASGTCTAKFIRLSEVKLYAGYATGEEYPDDLPLTLVATFTPENSPDNDIQFDVSEYLKSIFRIEPPTEGIDYNMFNRFRLFYDGYYWETFQVLNSSIPTDILMSDYANTGNPLNEFFPSIIFSCGRTIISYLENNVVTNVISINDDLILQESEGDYYHGDYSAADYYVNDN